ncbi:hypothetical protein SO802_028970 [Lithocarpus litseifolius]|uniref:Uncharacterized protein n=1 Tax=Lithocarpus litseifolius TaxID=425828 RepID=A0AAW2BS80_9ROSI
MGNHRVVFVFSDVSDVDKVLAGEPWTFDKHLVAMQRVEKHVDVRDLELTTTRFRVQVHDLPIGLNLCVAKDIVSIARDMDEDGAEIKGYNFQRLRVGGLVLNMRGFQIYVTGVGNLHTLIKSARFGDNLMVAENLVPTFKEQLVEIDVGISRFDSLIGREDGSGLELYQRFLPQQLDGVGM